MHDHAPPSPDARRSDLHHGAETPGGSEDALSLRLKRENADLHDVAEASELPRMLLKGPMSREQYADALLRELPLHRALDAACRRAREARPSAGWRALFDEKLLHSGWLEEDLAFLGVDHAAARPHPSAERALAFLARELADPVATLGLHYIRTGQTNGNRFIARAVRKHAGLPATGEGTRHMDPWGADQPAIWAAFKRDLDAGPWTAAEVERVLASARAMYVGVLNTHSDAWQSEADLLAIGAPASSH
jgi:heme oxygenase